MTTIGARFLTLSFFPHLFYGEFFFRPSCTMCARLSCSLRMCASFGICYFSFCFPSPSISFDCIFLHSFFSLYFHSPYFMVYTVYTVYSQAISQLSSPLSNLSVYFTCDFFFCVELSMSLICPKSTKTLEKFVTNGK